MGEKRFISKEKRTYKSHEKKKEQIKLINKIIFCLLLLLSILGLCSYGLLKGKLPTEIISFGYIGIFVLIFFLEAIPQAFHPFFCIIIANSLGINLFYSIVVAVLASFFGSVFGFEVGRKYGYVLLSPYFHKKSVKKLIELWEKKGYLFVFFAAITPLPYFSLVFGTLGLERKRFLVYGALVRALSYFVLGIFLKLGISFLII